MILSPIESNHILRGANMMKYCITNDLKLIYGGSYLLFLM